MVYKGFVGGQVGGYFLERGMRLSYLHEQQSLWCSPHCAAPSTNLGPSPVAATSNATPRWAAHELRMHPITLKFRSAALESSYRHHVFSRTSHVWMGLAASSIAMQFVEVLSGKAMLLPSLILIASENLPHCGRAFVSRRGDRPEEVERFRPCFLAYVVLLLVAKMFYPSAMGPVGQEDSANVETWYFLNPFFLRLLGPRASIWWLLSATAIAASHKAPSAFTWRGDQASDAKGLLDAVVAGEIVAYTLDWHIRAQFVRATLRKQADRSV